MPVSKKDFSRQVGLYNPLKLQSSIKIIGVGSVGSFITLALAKMGLTDIEIWDRDFIQAHNLPNQFFRLKDINSLKVVALQKIIKEYEGLNLKINKEHFYGHKLKGIVISAVDSIETRKFIWDELRTQKGIKFYIDTRMGGNLLRIYVVDLSNGKNKKYYEKTLKTEEIEHIPCTERTILYNILTISGLVANLVTKILKKEKFPWEIIFDLKLLELIKI